MGTLDSYADYCRFARSLKFHSSSHPSAGERLHWPCLSRSWGVCLAHSLPRAARIFGRGKLISFLQFARNTSNCGIVGFSVPYRTIPIRNGHGLGARPEGDDKEIRAVIQNVIRQDPTPRPCVSDAAHRGRSLKKRGFCSLLRAGLAMATMLTGTPLAAAGNAEEHIQAAMEAYRSGDLYRVMGDLQLALLGVKGEINDRFRALLPDPPPGWVAEESNSMDYVDTGYMGVDSATHAKIQSAMEEMMQMMEAMKGQFPGSRPSPATAAGTDQDEDQAAPTCDVPRRGHVFREYAKGEAHVKVEILANSPHVLHYRMFMWQYRLGPAAASGRTYDYKGYRGYLSDLNQNAGKRELVLFLSPHSLVRLSFENLLEEKMLKLFLDGIDFEKLKESL